MTVALSMSLPGLVGHWLDEWLGTGFVLLILGVLLGFATAFWQLLNIAKGTPHGRARARDRDVDESETHD